MVNNWKNSGEDRHDASERACDETSSDADGDVVYFDVAEMSDEETEWRPGLDDTRSMREGERGGGAVSRMLQGVSQCGSRMRIKVWLTRDGEPVTRADAHPGAWLELEAHIRDLEERAADGDRYRRMTAALNARKLIHDGENGETWWHKYCPNRPTFTIDGPASR